MATLTDEDLIRHLDACTLHPSQFPHREHVRLGWLYLQRRPLTEAVAAFSAGLKAFATALGKPDRYHETITWAYLLIIQDRMARQSSAAERSWEAFAADNADLIASGRQVLERYYRPETLDSPLARARFIWPDGLGR
jgi:hypothetical protein